MPHRDETNPPMLPAAPCVASPDVAEQLREIRETQQEIRTALVGNPKLGHKGLVARVETVEVLAEKHDRKLLVWGSVITAAVGSAQFLKDKIFGH